MTLEKVKNHKFRTDIYEDVVLETDSEIDLLEKIDIYKILFHEISDVSPSY